MNLDMVFWGYTLADLLLAAGRYTLAVTTLLLAIKHIVWFARGDYRRSRAWTRVARAGLELIVSGALAGLYWWHIVFAGADAVLGEVETIFVVWAMAILFTGLLMTRSEGRRVDDQ